MYRILVADDEPIERSVVSKKIQTFFPDQFEIVLAENGREAVSLFREKECQIALLDIEMPGMNGLEAAASIRAEDDYACIIFLTAFDEFDYAKKAITLRALDYLLKPGNDVELITAIEEAVREVEKLKSQPPENRKETSENTLCSEELGNVRVKAVAERILSYIDANYAQDISMQDAARAMGYADAYFCKIFKESFDKSFMVYLADYRMEKAKELLEDMTVNIKDVGSSVGYRDSNYFTKVFKRIVGVTPTEYRTQKLMYQVLAGVVHEAEKSLLRWADRRCYHFGGGPVHRDSSREKARFGARVCLYLCGESAGRASGGEGSAIFC